MAEEQSKSILFITPQPFFQWRGSPIRVKFDVEALSELGYSIDLLAFPFGEDPKIPGVNVVRIPNPFLVKNVPIGPSLVKAMLDIVLFFKAVTMANRRLYDVVHCVEDAGFIGAFIHWSKGYRFAYEKHSHTSSYRSGLIRNLVLRFYELIEAHVIRNADVVFAGPGILNQILCVDPNARIQTVYSIPSSRVAANQVRVREIRAHLGLAQDELLLTYVGTFAPYQGLDLLFAAMPVVINRKKNVRFLIIGGSAEEIAQKQDWLKERDVHKYVTFLGQIDPDETPHYLAASDVLLSPRRAGDTNPIKIFDYMKAGRAIVATNQISNRTILDESVSLLTSQTPRHFAEGILCLMNNPVLRDQLGINARKLVDKQYNYESFKEWMRAGYEIMQGS
jgi:glycosyltransferase involved in cell wall biosynthesis